MQEHRSGEKVQGEIYAVDQPDGTWYVLIREGEKPVMAAWPQPLELLCPEAVRAGTLGSEGSGRVGHVNGQIDEHTRRMVAVKIGNSRSMFKQRVRSKKIPRKGGAETQGS